MICFESSRKVTVTVGNMSAAEWGNVFESWGKFSNERNRWAINKYNFCLSCAYRYVGGGG